MQIRLRWCLEPLVQNPNYPYSGVKITPPTSNWATHTQPNQSLISAGTDMQTSCTSFRPSFPATRMKLLSSFVQHWPQSLRSQCSSAAISSVAQQEFA